MEYPPNTLCTFLRPYISPRASVLIIVGWLEADVPARSSLKHNSILQNIYYPLGKV